MRPLASDSAVAWRTYAESLELERAVPNETNLASYRTVMPLVLYRLDRLEQALVHPKVLMKASVSSPEAVSVDPRVVQVDDVSPADRLAKWPVCRPTFVTERIDSDQARFACDGEGRRLLYLGKIRRIES